MDRMEGILDVDARPPYVEVFSNHPLMFMSLCNHRLACSKSTPTELLFWSHGVQCTIDDVVSNLGLYKVKVFGHQGPSCMFLTSPDVPPKQQADSMFTAARQLQELLSKVELPGGDTLASQITIHAGSYAGGVVGKASWSYDVFGSDVQDLLDMDRFNTPNSIQVSGPALKLLSDVRQFAPACKLVCSGHEVVLHRWLGQALQPGSQATAGTAAAAAALKAPPAQEQLPATPPSPVKDPAAYAQQPLDANETTHKPYSSVQQLCAKGLSRSSSNLLVSAGAPVPKCMQQDLRFADSSLEASYLQSQVQQLSRMDMLFVVLVLCTMAGLACSHSFNMQLILGCCGQCLVPVAAAVWFCVRPHSYYRRREAVWVVHRVLTAVHLAGVLLYCIAQQRQQQLAGVAGMLDAGSPTIHGAPNRQQGIVGMLRSGAVLMLLGNLGFKVRFSAHLFTLALSAAVTVMGVGWQWSISGASKGASLAPWLWELLLRLSLGCLAPTALLYWWELDDRSLFLARSQQLFSCGVVRKSLDGLAADKPKLA